MTKEDKKRAKEEFKKTKRGKNILPILNRLIIEGVVCLAIALYLVIYTYIKEGIWWNYTLAGMLIIAGIIFLITQQKLRIKNYNIFLNTKRK